MHNVNLVLVVPSFVHPSRRPRVVSMTIVCFLLLLSFDLPNTPFPSSPRPTFFSSLSPFPNLDIDTIHTAPNPPPCYPFLFTCDLHTFFNFFFNFFFGPDEQTSPHSPRSLQAEREEKRKREETPPDVCAHAPHGPRSQD